MKYFLVFLLFSTSVFASSNNLLDKIKPKAFKELNWSNSFLVTDLIKHLGAPNKIQNNTYLYEINGIRYPLSFNFKNNKLTKIFILNTNYELTYLSLKDELKDFTRLELNTPESELHYAYVSKDKNIKLLFSRVDHSLYSIERTY